MILILIVVIAYACFISWSWIGWLQIPLERDVQPLSFPLVSVIVPARNEQANINQCLESLLHQDYPSNCLEVIVVDDHSTDDTWRLLEKFVSLNPLMNVKILKLISYDTSTKKEAIRIALSNATGKLILCTDADCILPVSWVKVMVENQLKNNSLFISGPVDLISGKSFFEKIQSLEFMGLTAITAAGFRFRQQIICNGANLAFTKDVYNEVHGHSGGIISATGDDTQLMLKIAKLYPGRLAFVKNSQAIVQTNSVSGFGNLLQQRKRWASKIPFSLTRFTLLIAVVAWLAHFSMIVATGMLFLNVIPVGFYLLFLAMKIVPEFLLLNSLSGFYRRKELLWLFLPAQPFYWVFIVLVGCIAPFGLFHWKGRNTR